jgi:hypothetical protein
MPFMGDQMKGKGRWVEIGRVKIPIVEWEAKVETWWQRLLRRIRRNATRSG